MRSSSRAENFGLGLVASLAAFTVWGLGVNIASVSYLSLLSDLTDDGSGWRSRAVSVMWTCMIVATIITSIVISRLLDPFSVSALYTAFGLVWLVASVFVLLGAAGIEPAAKPQQWCTTKLTTLAPPCGHLPTTPRPSAFSGI